MINSFIVNVDEAPQHVAISKVRNVIQSFKNQKIALKGISFEPDAEKRSGIKPLFQRIFHNLHMQSGEHFRYALVKLSS